MSRVVSRCDNCTLCCDLLEVESLNKPANTKCSHCIEGTGCGVWEQRPVVCRRYVCLWYANPKFPTSLRPDKCGVVFEPLRGRPILLALTSPNNADAWQDDLPFRLIKKFVTDGFAVIATDGSTKHLHLPPGVSEADVWAHVSAGMAEMEARVRRVV